MNLNEQQAADLVSVQAALDAMTSAFGHLVCQMKDRKVAAKTMQMAWLRESFKAGILLPALNLQTCLWTAPADSLHDR